jgi:hypothetical protein
MYVSGVLALGVAMFQRRPLESSDSGSATPPLVGLLAWAGRITAVAIIAAGLVMLSLGAFRNVKGVAVSFGAVIIAVAVWMLWGYFARGAKWSYYLVMLLAIANALGGLIAATVPAAGEALQIGDETFAAFAISAVSAVVVLIMLLPKTRHHFFSGT